MALQAIDFAPLAPVGSETFARKSPSLSGTCGCLTTRWSRPGQPGVTIYAILALAGRAAHLEAVRPPETDGQLERLCPSHPILSVV